MRMVRGSKFDPDITMGGYVSPQPPYKGADISYTAPEMYGKVLDVLPDKIRYKLGAGRRELGSFFTEMNLHHYTGITRFVAFILENS